MTNQRDWDETSEVTISRRGFIQSTAVGGCAIAVGGVVAGCGNDVVAAPVAEIAVGTDGRIGVLVPRYPELAALGGAITLDAGLMPGSAYPEAESGILLVHRADPPDAAPFVAFQSRCPHLGCPMGYSRADALIECPCHGSRFVASADPGREKGQGGCAGDPVHLPGRSKLTQWDVVYDEAAKTVWVDLGRRLTCQSGPANFPPVVNGTITLAVADFPALGPVGGSLIATPTGLADKIILVRTDANTVITTSAVCTHAGCDVEYQNSQLSCPCHASNFATSGAVLGGPAPRALRSYATTFDGQTIIITV